MQIKTLKKKKSVSIKGKCMARTNRMEPTHNYVKTNGLHVTWNGMNCNKHIKY
jgi:hypothetical protein